jgi:hypothetical protein
MSVPVLKYAGGEPARLPLGEPGAEVTFVRCEPAVPGDGPGAGRCFGVDLSHDSIGINAEYTT